MSPLQTSPSASNRSSPSFQMFRACHFYMGVYIFLRSAIFQFRLLCRRCRSFFTRGSTPCDDWLKAWATVSECEALGSQVRQKMTVPGTCNRSQQAARKRVEPSSPGARLPRSLILLCLDSCVFSWLFLFHTTSCQLSVSLWCSAMCNQNLFSSSLYTKNCSSRAFSRKKNSCVFMRMLGVVVSDKCLDSSLKPKGQETLL